MEPTLREYFSIPGYMYLWGVTIIALSLFTYRLIYFVKAIRLGKSENRFENIPRRLTTVLRDVFLQPRISGGIIHPAHLTIFWGFVFYAGSFWLTLLKGLFPFLPYPFPEEIAVVRFILEIFGVSVLVGLGIASIRRYILKPIAMKQSMDAGVITGLIACLMITFLVGSAANITLSGEQPSALTPVGSLLWLAFFKTLPMHSAEAWTVTMWWAHMLLVLGFLAYLPYSKHLHLLAAPFNVFFTDFKSPGSIRKEEFSSEPSKQFDLRDFTWRELLSPLACAECGRCDRSCPAFNSGTSFTPQTMIHHLKEHILEAGPVLLDRNRQNGSFKKLIEDLITPDDMWSCTTCLSCVAHCPVRNEHLPLIIRLRRYLVNEGKVETELQDTLMSFHRYGNSFSQSERMRAKWTQGLPFKIKDARKEPVDYLWFVGDYASYDPRVQEVTRTVAKLFNASGIDYGILYESERNSGNDLRRIGEEGLFETIVEKNIATLSKCTFKTIVTTDPHTYNTLKNEYPEFGATYTVLHYTELFHQLLQSGKLPLRTRFKENVTYHDPCYLARYNNIIEEPRELLKALGMNLIELQRNKNDAYCCGAGGGKIWVEDKPGLKERPAENRIREAAALPDVHTIVVSCPKDIVMFQDAIKTTGTEATMNVKDLSELLWLGCN